MKILICFDGTANEPNRAQQEVLSNGESEDTSISNVLKFHLLAGGMLDSEPLLRESGKIPEQLSLYFSGVGTRGNSVWRLFRQALAFREPERILELALEELETVYEAGDLLYVFGFSRGAAIARKFCTMIAERGIKTQAGPVDPEPVVELLGVWDTVASFGLPELDRDELPDPEELLENGSIAPVIRNAYHLLALDEERLAFRPTLTNAQPEVQEIWFAGVHSDVGGGFRVDGLSDVTLQFMVDQGRRLGLDTWDFEIQPETFEGTDQNGETVRIDRDDLEIRPNPLALIHRSDRGSIKSRLSLETRRFFVLRSGQPSETDLPQIHASVVERIQRDPEYRPDALRGVPHQVVEPDGRRRRADGLRDHLPIVPTENLSTVRSAANS